MQRTAIILIPLTFFFAILYLGLPAEIGEAARANRILLIPVILPLLYFAYSAKGKWREGMALSATLILFALPLAGLWTSGASEQDVIAGLLPYSDAQGYYGDALSLLNGGRFFWSPRPLFPGALASLLWLTFQNLQLSLAIFTAMVAIACHLAARQIQANYGTAPASLFLALLFFYYRRFTGAALTEHLGITLGALSLTLLLSAARERSKRNTLVGIFLAALALNARAGTFFMLPCLVVWSGWEFRGATRFSWWMAVRAAGAVTLAFLLNYLLFWLAADMHRSAFDNFSYTLYGLAVGGKGWAQFMVDHPEAIGHPEMVYGLAREAFILNPGNLLLGFLKSWLDFIIPKGQNDLFGFIAGLSNSWVNILFRVFLYALSLGGLSWLVCKRGRADNRMFLWGLLGIWLSVPFVPPVDADVMRAYAASIPFLMTLPAIGLKLGLERLKWTRFSLLDDSIKTSSRPAIVLGGLVVFLAVCMPLLIRLTTSSEATPPLVCPEGQTAITGRIQPGTTVTLSRGASACGKLPDICYADFLRVGMPGNQEQFDELRRTIEKNPGDVTLAGIFDLRTMQLYQVIIPNRRPPEAGEQFSACITSTTSGLQFYQVP